MNLNWIHVSLRKYSRVLVAFCNNFLLDNFYCFIAFNTSFAYATLRLYPWYNYQLEVWNKLMLKNKNSWLLHAISPARTLKWFQIRRRLHCLVKCCSLRKLLRRFTLPLCTCTMHFYCLGSPCIIQGSTDNVWKTCVTFTKPWANTWACSD